MKDKQYGMFIGFTISAIVYTFFETFISPKYPNLEVLIYFIYPFVILIYFLFEFIKDSFKGGKKEQ